MVPLICHRHQDCQQSLKSSKGTVIRVRQSLNKQKKLVTLSSPSSPLFCSVTLKRNRLSKYRSAKSVDPDAHSSLISTLLWTADTARYPAHVPHLVPLSIIANVHFWTKFQPPNEQSCNKKLRIARLSSLFLVLLFSSDTWQTFSAGIICHWDLLLGPTFPQFMCCTVHSWKDRNGTFAFAASFVRPSFPFLSFWCRSPDIDLCNCAWCRKWDPFPRIHTHARARSLERGLTTKKGAVNREFLELGRLVV